MSKQSPERLEYLRNYRKNHKEQQRKYQKKYIDKLRQQGKYPISTSMKLRNEIEELQQELQRKDNIINDLKSSIVDYQEAVGDYQDELKRKDNNWNELKKFLIDLQKLKGINQQGFSWGVCQEALDKIKELEIK